MKRLALAAAVMSLTSFRVYGQETDTEKGAARDVIRKMAEFEQSLDVPSLVARLTGPNAERDGAVARTKELMDKELLAMADDIATHPETWKFGVTNVQPQPGKPQGFDTRGQTVV